MDPVGQHRQSEVAFRCCMADHTARVQENCKREQAEGRRQALAFSELPAEGQPGCGDQGARSDAPCQKPVQPAVRAPRCVLFSRSSRLLRMTGSNPANRTKRRTSS
jgi:hypothetical protein